MATNTAMCQNPLNMNISAYRVLYILFLLVQYRSLNVTELNQLLFENPFIQRVYNNETLTKYINTLRRVGCDIPRSSVRTDYCYELLRHPFPMGIQQEELAAVDELMGRLTEQPDERLQEGFRDILRKMLWMAGCEESKMTAICRGFDTKAELAGPSDRKTMLQMFRAYCEEAFVLEIQYRPANGQPVVKTSLLEPHQLLEKGGRLLLLGMEQGTSEKRLIDLDKIVSARQLPGKNKRGMPDEIVRFELYGRLAATYRLYPGEKIVLRQPERIQIRTKVTEPSVLIARLLRYGHSCQVIAPVSVRNMMKQQIERMLLVQNEEAGPAV